MYGGVNETQCTYCGHRHVCSYKEQFLAAQKAVDEISVSIGDGSYIKLNAISWIQPVKLMCSFCSSGYQTITRGNPMNDKDG